MKSKIFSSVLVLLLAMNIGAATMFGLRLIKTRSAGAPKECPLITKDTYLFTLLGLSQEQLALITPMARDFHEELDKLSIEIHEKRNIMIDMMEQDPVDMEQVNLVRKEMLAIQSTIQQRVFEHIMKMKQVLNPEQGKEFFKALRQSMIAHNLKCDE